MDSSQFYDKPSASRCGQLVEEDIIPIDDEPDPVIDFGKFIHKYTYTCTYTCKHIHYISIPPSSSFSSKRYIYTTLLPNSISNSVRGNVNLFQILILFNFCRLTLHFPKLVIPRSDATGWRQH